MVTDHAGHVQILDNYHPVLADKPSCSAMQEVLAAGADLAVGAGDLCLSLCPIVRPFPAAGQPPLVAR
jgi:hypothetical protein